MLPLQRIQLPVELLKLLLPAEVPQKGALGLKSGNPFPDFGDTGFQFGPFCSGNRPQP